MGDLCCVFYICRKFDKNSFRLLFDKHLRFQYMDKFHYFWWHTGQYALIMGVFVLWVMTVAGRPENKSIKKNYTR